MLKSTEIANLFSQLLHFKLRCRKHETILNWHCTGKSRQITAIIYALFSNILSDCRKTMTKTQNRKTGQFSSIIQIK